MPKTKTLIIITEADDYCSHMKLLYAAGYAIHHKAAHPRSIYLPITALGYVEQRDITANEFRFVIYGRGKGNRGHNNARIIHVRKEK